MRRRQDNTDDMSDAPQATIEYVSITIYGNFLKVKSQKIAIWKIHLRNLISVANNDNKLNVIGVAPEG